MEEVQTETEETLRHLIKAGKVYRGLSVGLKQSVRSIEQRNAQLCILAGDCNEQKYVDVITGLCKEAKVPVFSYAEGQKKLGELVGLCKIDKDGKPRKVVRCSCVVIQNCVHDHRNSDLLTKLAAAKA